MLHSSSRGNFVWEMAPTHLSTIVWGAEKRYVVNSIHVYATLNNSQLGQ